MRVHTKVSYASKILLTVLKHLELAPPAAISFNSSCFILQNYLCSFVQLIHHYLTFCEILKEFW